jgi:putative membrane protein
MNLLVRLLINGVVIYYLSSVFEGVHVNDFMTAIIVTLVLAILNTFIKPLLLILTLPITILTLGLFSLVINTIVMLITANLITGFEIDGFINAFYFSLVLSILGWIINKLAKD